MTTTPLMQLEQWLDSQIIGQQDLIHKLLIALLADGHLLVEGAPGLAKTRAIKQMSEGIEGSFHRIQFTPGSTAGRCHGHRYLQAPTRCFRISARANFQQFNPGGRN